MLKKIIIKLTGLSIICISFFGLYTLYIDTEAELNFPIRSDLKKKPQLKKISNKKQKASKTEPKILKPWKEDLLKLDKSNLLPYEWDSIKKVRVILLDENLHSQLKGLRPPIRTKKEGSYILEVSFMSHETESIENSGKLGIITQYNLIHIQTGEMIWEHSSLFYTSL